MHCEIQKRECDISLKDYAVRKVSINSDLTCLTDASAGAYGCYLGRKSRRCKTVGVRPTEGGVCV